MIVPILALAMMLPEDMTTGSHLYRACKTSSDSFARADQRATPLETALSSECLSYVGGFIDAQNLREKPLFCLGDATMGTTVRVYLKYMDENPKTLDSPRWVGLSLALILAWIIP